MEKQIDYRRRNIIKNIAIAFLGVMLILTFFSNTINNYMLPIVSVEYANGASLNNKIRGTGYVTANQNSQIALSETRTIKEIFVRQGDTVKAGDVIMLLEDGASDEYITELQTLNNLILQNKQTQLSTQKSLAEELEALEKKADALELAKTLTGVNAETIIAELRTAAYGAQAEVDKIQKQINDLKDKMGDIDWQLGDDMTTAQLEKKLKSLKSAYESAVKATKDAKAALEAADEKNADYLSQLADAQDELSDAEDDFERFKDKNTKPAEVTNLSELKTAMDDAKTALDASPDDTALQDAYNTAKAAYDTAKAQDDKYNNYITRYNNYEEAVNDAEREVTRINKKITDSSSESANANAVYTKAQTAEAEAKAEYDKYDIYTNYNEYTTQLTELQTKFDSANSTLDRAKNKQTEADKYASMSDADRATAVTKLQREYDSDSANYDVSRQLANAQITSGNLAVEAQQNKVNKLKESAIDTEVKTKISGTVSSVNVVVGEKVEAGNTIAEVQLTEKGFTMNYTMTAAQASQIKVGDTATVQYYYYGVTPVVTVAAIKNDPSSRNKNKIVTFTVTGDLNDGQSITFSIGSNSSYYDTVVPTNALHEDNKGKFVLVVQSKGTPLGNRYTAVRYDVEVVASDDTRSAVSGTLGWGDYVLISSTKPVSAGDQVRLADN